MKWFVVVLACAACHGAAVNPYELAETRVHDGVSRGLGAANDVGPADLSVRFNPAPCECPPYEVFAYGRWMRAFVDFESPVLDSLQTGDPLAVAKVVLRVQSKRRAAKNGVLYPVVATGE